MVDEKLGLKFQILKNKLLDSCKAQLKDINLEIKNKKSSCWI